MRALRVFTALLYLSSPALAADEPSDRDGLMLSSVDRTIDPCDDFYQYACHGWLTAHPIPPDESSWDVGSPLVERNNEKLRQILETASQHPDAETQRIGDYWTACIDQTAIDRLGLAPVQPALDRIDQLQDLADLAPLIAYLHQIGTDVFFNVTASQDFSDATTVIAELDQGGMGLPDQSYYTKTDVDSRKLQAEYRQHLIRLAALIGLPPAQATRQGMAAYRVELALARASLSEEARVDPAKIYHLVEPATLKTLFPRFNWHSYLSALGLGEITRLNLVVPGFVKSLQRLTVTTPLDDIKAYLRLRLVEHATEALPTVFQDENFRFFSDILRGIKAQKPRWKQCVTAEDQDLGEDLGKIYIRTNFGSDAKQRTQTLVKNLKSAFAEELQVIPWMGDVTRQKALEKLDAMVEKIGYPETWRDYSGLRITTDDALGNMFRAAEFEFRRQVAKIGKPVDRNEWAMTPPTVNAYYDDQKNDINFPAGTLQPPYFNPAWDDAINYGSIGATIGHEMTHGFDNSGRKFDRYGNLRNWWTKRDTANFETRSACLVKEYDGFKVTGDVSIDGSTTLGENTADNGGIRLAYRALEKALDGKPQALIDGYTQEQRFFLAYAQSFCENQTDASAVLQASSDPHATSPYRVNGVLRNMTEFRREFACKEGQKMAPAQTCRIW